MLLKLVVALAGMASPDPVAAPPAEAAKLPSPRLLAHLCRRADPKGTVGGAVARVSGHSVRYEDKDILIVRTVPEGLHPNLKRRLIDISLKDVSAVANCVGRESRARSFGRRWQEMLYERTGTWQARAATRRIRQYFPDDRDSLGNVYGPAEQAVFWDVERRRLLVLADFFEPRRRRDFAALICRKLREHPQRAARAMRCPGLSRIAADLLKEHCLDPERIARVRFWVAELRTGIRAFPEGWHHFGIDVDAGEFIGLLAPEMKSAFESEIPGACPAVA